MAVVMDRELQRKLEKVKKRETWPVALLAQVLGCSKKYVYRKIDAGDFDVMNDIGYIKISSDSVVKYYEEKNMQKV